MARRVLFELLRRLHPSSLQRARPFIITLDIEIVAPLSDVIGKALYLHGTFERHTTAALRMLVPADGVVVEAGAHLGNHTLLAAKLVGPSGAVLAFEPNVDVHALLARSLVRNQFAQVTLLPIGLGERDEQVRFHVPADDNPGQARMDPGGARVVRVRPLDDVIRECRLSRLDVLKIDVEGAEAAVLRGATEALKRYKPAIILECEGSTAAAELLQTELNYDLYAMRSRGTDAVDLIPITGVAEAQLYREPYVALDVVALPR